MHCCSSWRSCGSLKERSSGRSSNSQQELLHSHLVALLCSIQSSPLCESVDGELPSVNTCRHFIKLPPYSSKNHHAIISCCQCFHFAGTVAAARAYDQAVIKFRGVDPYINFSLDDYKEDVKKMSGLSKEEFVQVLRRQGAGFVWGSSRFWGVTLRKCGKCEARMSQLMGKKFMYLGLYDTEMDAAKVFNKSITSVFASYRESF